MSTEITQTPINEAQELEPSWYRRFREMYLSNSGICFVVTGDIHGLAARDVSQLFYLQKSLSSKFSVVAYYHRAAGICFPLDAPFEDPQRKPTAETSMRERAKELLGPFFQPPSDDPYATALQASGVLATSDVFNSARKPKAALSILEQLLRAKKDGEPAREQVAVIIDCTDYLCPPTEKAHMTPDALDVLATLQYWGTDRSLHEQGNPVFLLTKRLSDLHEDLRDSDSGYKVLTVDLPNERARMAYITWHQHNRLARRLPAIPLLDLTIADMARTTGGASLQDVENMLLQGALEVQAGQGPVGVTRITVKSYKDDIIASKYGEIATMLEPLPGGFDDLGGMDHLISLTRDTIITPMHEGRIQDVLSRFLLAGPPGTGKTYYAQALATEIGFSAFALNMENILNKWVGSSERNLREFFHFARALAPVLIFLDEADQTDLARRGDGAGSATSSNLFGSMLRFAGDPALQGQVILVLASNRPDLFDAALLRRLDAIIPVLLADEPGRLLILEKQAAFQRTGLHSQAAQWLARQTDFYSANDLAKLIREARWQAGGRGSAVIEQQDAEAALLHLRPSVARETAEWFTLKAIDACNNLRFCPPTYVPEWRNRKGLRERIQEQERSLPVGPRQARTW